MRLSRNYLKNSALAIIILFGLFTIIASGGSSESVSGGGSGGGGGGSNTPPTVTIVSPTDGSSYPVNDYVDFTGSAVDSSSNQITGVKLVWSSSRNGTLGTGNSLRSNDLNAGAHVITLTATDSNGLVSSKSINMTIKQQANTSPTIKIIKPADASTVNAGDLVLFEGTGTDTEDGNLPNNKLTWFSNIDKELGTGATLQKDSLSGGKHTISLIGEDSEGLQSSASITLTVQNTRPTATITFPADGSTYTLNETITFNGEGTDTEDGDLYDKSLVWRSSIYGQFGTGRDLEIKFLPAGTHKITLTVKDKNGAVNTAQITITIS